MKTCKKCGVSKIEELFEKEKRVKSGIGANCIDCHKRYFRELAVRYYSSNPEKFKIRNRLWWKNNPTKTKDIHINSRLKLRKDVFAILGGGNPRCNCCGEKKTEFLSVDHINGGGNKERETNNLSSSDQFYRFVRDSNNPKLKYQILCFNCNLAKGFNGSCPHNKIKYAKD